MDWTNAIQQLREEGYFGDVILFHNGSSKSKDGVLVSYEDLEILEDATNTDVKPTKKELDSAYMRYTRNQSEITQLTMQRRGAFSEIAVENIEEEIAEITDLDSAKRVILEISRLLIEMRNHVWPDLQQENGDSGD